MFSVSRKQELVPATSGSLLLGFTIAFAATVSFVGSGLVGLVGNAWLNVVAAMFALLACVPPLWIARIISNGAVAQMAVPVWRLGVLLPAIVWSMQLTAAARNYFCVGLLACYFAALPLESWLLARQVKHS